MVAFAVAGARLIHNLSPEVDHRVASKLVDGLSSRPLPEQVVMKYKERIGCFELQAMVETSGTRPTMVDTRMGSLVLRDREIVTAWKFNVWGRTVDRCCVEEGSWMREESNVFVFFRRDYFVVVHMSHIRVGDLYIPHQEARDHKATWPREEVISPTKVFCRCSHYPANFWSLCEFQVRRIVSHPYVADNALVQSAMTRAVQAGSGIFLKGFVPDFGQLVLDAKRRRVCVPNEVMRIVFQFAGRDSRRSPHPVALAFLSDPEIQEVMARRKRIIRRGALGWLHFSVDVSLARWLMSK